MNKILLALLALILALPCAAQAQESTINISNADVAVTDGDSLYFGSLEVRLLCLDAVELHQNCEDAEGNEYACGELAQKAMAAAIDGQPVKCHGDEADKYHRPLVRCWAGKTDLSRAMIKEGWAVATCRRMKSLEAEAREAKRGIWQGTFDTPAAWRKAHPWKDQTAEAIAPN